MIRIDFYLLDTPFSFLISDLLSAPFTELGKQDGPKPARYNAAESYLVINRMYTLRCHRKSLLLYKI